VVFTAAMLLGLAEGHLAVCFVCACWCAGQCRFGRAAVPHVGLLQQQSPTMSDAATLTLNLQVRVQLITAHPAALGDGVQWTHWK